MLATDWLGQAIVPVVISLIALLSGVITKMVTNRRVIRARELSDAAKLKREEEEETKKANKLLIEAQNRRIEAQGVKIRELSGLMNQVTVALAGEEAGPLKQKTIGLVEVVGSLAESVAGMQRVMATKNDVDKAEKNLTVLISEKGLT